MPSKARTRVLRRKWADSGCIVSPDLQRQVRFLAHTQITSAKHTVTGWRTLPTTELCKRTCRQIS